MPHKFFIEDWEIIPQKDLINWSRSPLSKLTPVWIQDIHSFLAEWFSPDPKLKLQTSGTVSKKNFLEKKNSLFLVLKKA